MNGMGHRGFPPGGMPPVCALPAAPVAGPITMSIEMRCPWYQYGVVASLGCIFAPSNAVMRCPELVPSDFVDNFAFSQAAHAFRVQVSRCSMPVDSEASRRHATER